MTFSSEAVARWLLPRIPNSLGPVQHQLLQYGEVPFLTFDTANQKRKPDTGIWLPNPIGLLNPCDSHAVQASTPLDGPVPSESVLKITR
jgi:hypothetical protein